MGEREVDKEAGEVDLEEDQGRGDVKGGEKGCLAEPRSEREEGREEKRKKRQGEEREREREEEKKATTTERVDAADDLEAELNRRGVSFVGCISSFNTLFLTFSVCCWLSL